MKVLLVEKPSMIKKYQEALKGEDIEIVNSVGHIDKLIPIEHYFSKEKMKWKDLLEKLPYVPENFELEIDKPDIYKKIVSKFKEADEIILCCDPDREGELIHRSILHIAQKEGYVKTKNITRIWLNSETKDGIKDAFNKRKSYLEYDSYYRTAYTRMLVDWLIGIQLTVLYSVKFNNGLLSVGRIQSWLLSAIVERYNQFINFTPKDFWKISFLTKDNVNFNYIDEEEKIKIIETQEEFKLKSELMNNKDLVIDSIDKKDFLEYAPSLYKISTLQKVAAKKFKLSPKRTLEILQKLYNDYNLITYPRTDCDVLSEEEAKYIGDSLELVKKFNPELVENIIKENPKFELNSKYIGKIKGHFAIIPVFNFSGDIPKLNTDEANIMNLIIDRFAGALLPPIQGERILIKAHLTGNENEKFLADVKIIKNEGYKKYFSKDDDDDNDDENENTENIIQNLNYNPNDILKGKMEFKKEKTKAKKLYKDESIIGLMEKAHLFVKDEKMKTSLKNAEGIGTGATRDSFIPILLERGYIIEDKKNYTPTQKGLDLYNVLPEELKIPDFSASLEYEFKKIIDGEGKKIEDFISDTKLFLETVFNKIQNSEVKFQNNNNKNIFGVCPVCKKDFIDGTKSYFCSDYKEGCKFSIWKEIAGKKITEKNVKDLISSGKTGLIKGFVNKAGKKFDACLKVDGDKVVFDFSK